MAMTPTELLANAQKAQDKWGDYGLKIGDDMPTVCAKVSIQIEILMQQNKKLGDALDQLTESLRLLGGVVGRLEENSPARPKLILPG